MTNYTFRKVELFSRRRLQGLGRNVCYCTKTVLTWMWQLETGKMRTSGGVGATVTLLRWDKYCLAHMHTLLQDISFHQAPVNHDASRKTLLLLKCSIEISWHFKSFGLWRLKRLFFLPLKCPVDSNIQRATGLISQHLAECWDIWESILTSQSYFHSKEKYLGWRSRDVTISTSQEMITAR